MSRFEQGPATDRAPRCLVLACQPDLRLTGQRRCPGNNLLPLPGFRFDDCVPFTGDATRAPLSFRDQRLADMPADRPLHLPFELCRGELYGYEWRR